jgi:hypothetical protein
MRCGARKTRPQELADSAFIAALKSNGLALRDQDSACSVRRQLRPPSRAFALRG